MPISSFKRYELKYLVCREQLDALLPCLLRHTEPDDYCKNGGDYPIYNVYFDTPDSALIRESLAKPYYKEKLRLRSYSSPAKPGDRVFLELKKKTGGIVHKRRAAMTLAESAELLAHGKTSEGSGYMNGQVTRELLYFLSLYKLNPAVYIGYRRMAFTAKCDRSLRITFDFDIVTRRRELTLERECYGRQLLNEGWYLMEIKLSGAMPAWLASLLSEHTIHKTSFSKYGAEYKNHCLEQYAASGGLDLSGSEAVFLHPGLCVNF